MNTNYGRVTLFMFSLLLAAPSLAEALKPTPASAITAEAARIMAAAAERAARAQGFAIVISIVDNHGNLKHFHRMDGASSGSIKLAQLKASTSARFPLSSSSLAERSAALPANPYASLPGFTLLGGGLPILDANGEHIGGIGISGATPELDAQFAQAALDSGA
ncbi:MULTISPECIES: GlcG/HbpS family heme-binding protein [Pseudomonas]|nr:MULTISPECIES: heme-binding protein [Pseudomonas]MDH1576032.1 heme-binding protein [Pseudomonas sp. GD03746]QQE83633.1 heme-binding protein [Pseudomonas putida]UTL80784.1 heme-binding protein [Pseudomonas putida]HEN8713403.1 heme-binding protein [Pseudomonas putida]HEN8718340.1 heme-binding protein [Pseudomonas putida]